MIATRRCGSLILTLVALCISSFTGCSGKEGPPAASARVSATKAFATYFGPAPTTTKGTCFAFVIYFPSARQAGKVVPLPFFTFDESSIKKVALQRQLGGVDEKAYAGELLQLFPRDVRLLSVAQQGGTVTANYSKELGAIVKDQGRAATLQNAIVLTLMQFSGVTGVRIQSEGTDLFPSGLPPVAESAVVQQPSPPRLLNVMAMKETALAPVGEVDVIFDRPVDIKEFQISTADGAPLKADIFHSMFDMAAVVKPKEPAKLTAGTKVKVRWSVVDKVGRAAAGENVYPLDVRVHQE